MKNQIERGRMLRDNTLNENYVMMFRRNGRGWVMWKGKRHLCYRSEVEEFSMFKACVYKEKEKKNWEKPLVKEKRKYEKKRKKERNFERVAMWHSMWEDLGV